MIRFYAPGLPENIILPENDSGHAVRVLRMKAGDTLEAVDGRGNLYRCTLVDAHPKHASLRIDDVSVLPKSWKGSITLAIAPTKNMDRMEWLVEKLVEIGVDRIVPLRCHHSERKDINVERLRKIAVSAMKQSLKAILPEIDTTMSFSDFIHSVDAGNRYIAYCDPSIPRRLFSSEYRPGEDTVILIGPEGDFSSSEIREAIDGGWNPVSLGESRLRTETAALVAVDTCHIMGH